MRKHADNAGGRAGHSARIVHTGPADMNLRLASVTRKELHRLGLGYKRILDGSKASGSGDVLERAAFMRGLSQLIQRMR